MQLRLVAVAATALTLVISPVAAAAAGTDGSARPMQYRHLKQLAAERAAHAKTFKAQAADSDEGGEDPEEIAEQAEQWAEARSAPGIVAPGAYSAAWQQQQSLPHTGGSWTHVTNRPYNSDDPRYRDIESNSSGGAGLVTGRVTGLAADNYGDVYAGAANGGVWRSTSGGGHWTPISEKLPTPSTGDLRLDSRGRLWLATGEANTGATSFVGTGVYVLGNPRSGSFTPADRVGGTELESTIIRKLRFIGTTVWAATSSGAWTHSLTNLQGPWTRVFAPNPAYLAGGASAADPSAPYKNIVNDFAVDPKNPGNVIIAAGWRSGDTYNGFYTRTATGSWQQTTLAGLPSTSGDVGLVTFAAAADGSRYYAIEQSPTQLATNPDSALGGFFVSKSGSPFGPWTLAADYHKLAASGSALTDPGYMPGIQAWYNQFLQVDPTDGTHVWAGLEEVFESTDSGDTWTTPGPYWNFGFPCWSIDPSKQTGDCHQTVHADQHSIAVGSRHGKSYVVVGDDGGMYRRPVRGNLDQYGHALDWSSLNDGSMDVLQYYSVDAGRDRGGLAISGGLQDNGQSVLRPGDRVMGSNFGGDGGDTIVDPANGCNIAEEYVYLDVWVTNNCAVNDGAWTTDPAKATSYEVAPEDSDNGLARFIAPITQDPRDSKTWIAGGRHVWLNTVGYAIRSGEQWTSLYDLGAGHVATAVTTAGGMVYAAWCGPCNNQGYARGIAVGRTDGTGWHQLNLPVDGTVPNRYISGMDVDRKNPQHVIIAVNGFSRKWTEGPGAGVGHVFESWNAGNSWTDISANLPDVPANSVRMVPGGGLVLGTDTGVFYRAPRCSGWSILGHGLPTTVTLQVKVGPDGKVYVATHGRGQWSFRL
ncbi:glycosyl hydrolase [Actinoplanes sp. KI2]|uniref:glycosyl hydrolase n=1 Tax=Actinoplanes sp. KI2 TaxID=2983315 RepID=UPI0021D5FF8C|nr:glycosyl hydrolase [Actinoplanes sp. KI2]MCU7728556.1 glycosyl hydrolase [Actinoplanes sp. KI2]